MAPSSVRREERLSLSKRRLERLVHGGSRRALDFAQSLLTANGMGVVLLAACDRAPSPPPMPGARLEAAAVQAGLVADPRGASIIGSWARENDRVCVVPAGMAMRIGAIVDYGQGNGCAASGTIAGDGTARRVTFGNCRIEVRYEGDRIVFPAAVPKECESLCVGRASLAALNVDRLSASVSEASMLRTPRGKLLCVD